MPFRSPNPASFKNLFVSDLGTLKNLVEGMPVAIGIAALDRRTAGPMVVPESRIVYYNRKWRETFGFGTEDCATAGEATLRLYPDAEQRAENYRRREEAVRKALATGKPAEPLQMRARVADGSTRTFLTGTTVLEGMMVVSMEDATALEAGVQEGGGGFPGKERVAVARAGAPELMVALDAVAAVEADGKYTRVLSGSCWTPDGRNIGTWQRMLPELERLDRSTLVRVPWVHAVQSYGRGGRISFAHAAVSLDVGRAGRERLMTVLKKKGKSGGG